MAFRGDKFLKNISVIGAGAWGTAIANTLIRSGSKEIFIWAREESVMKSINSEGINKVYLPDCQVLPGIFATNNLTDIFSKITFLVVPCQFLRQIVEEYSLVCKKFNQDTSQMTIVVCSKGIELNTLSLMSEVVRDVLPDINIAVLSGPTFAKEVANGKPTAITLAADNQKFAKDLAVTFQSTNFRPYLSSDIIGVQVSAALKNVLAIACGVVSGSNLGENAVASLITRGLKEIRRLGLALGGSESTFFGLSGVGDIVLTCTSRQSRNFSLGAELGAGKSFNNNYTRLAEGVATTRAAKELAVKLDVEMPIVNAMDQILNEKATIASVINSLLQRPIKKE